MLFLPDKQIVAVKYPPHKPKDKKLPSGEWELLEDFSIWVTLTDGVMYTITVFKGYTYDGFSIPWLFRWFHGEHEDAIGVALIHDLDFETHFSLYRGRADWLFLLGLQARGYWWITRNTMYSALRLFGYFVYQKTPDEIQSKQKYILISKLG